MKKKFNLLLVSALIFCLFLSSILPSKIEAQYLPGNILPYLQNVQYTQPISMLYLGNNTLIPFNGFNNYIQNWTYPFRTNLSQGSSWNLSSPIFYPIQNQQSSTLSPISQNVYQAASNINVPSNPSSFNQTIFTPEINPAFIPSSASFYRAGSIPLYPASTFSTLYSTPTYYSNQLTPRVTQSFNQSYYSYPSLNQGGINLPQGYIPNTNFSSSVLSAQTTSDIRVTAVIEATLVLANPEYGMYCWDPPKWIEGGYQVGVWCPKIPFRAQSLDKRGRLYNEAPGFTVDPTGESGLMELFDGSISLYRGPINANGPADYLVTVVVDSASTVAVGKRRNASCDACHPTPPGHIGTSISWGNCHECHNLGDKMHRHAYKAYVPIDKCYTCHPSGCLSGAHGQRGIWCTPCHGTLEDAAYGKMKISGQLGKPLCADCHDPLHSEPGGDLFVNSSGHGGIWCINCHGATHVELSQPVGLNNCTYCHTVQASIKWMGPNCALCHGSSFSPHFVKSL